MTSRADEMGLPVRTVPAGARAAVRHRHLSGGQRFLFVLALLTFALASFYNSVVLLTRVTPALFPGKTFSLPIVDSVIDTLPDSVRPAVPGAESSFNKRINWLIIGVDKRPGDRDEDAYNTDTLMVATVDPLSKVSSILSFPRDMWIDIHPPQGGSYKGRINASYAAGFLNNGGSFEAGAEQLKTDLKKDFGIEINYWLWLDFKGVEKLIDTLGGIDVDIPHELSVPQWYYSDDDVHARYVSFPPGPQHLDGYNAVAFGRYRNDSDLYRVKRQQLVLQTAVKKIFSRGLLQNLTEVKSLWDAFSATIHTDMSYTKMISILPLMQETNGRMNLFSLGDPVNGAPTVEGYTTPDGASVLTWNAENVQNWLSQAFTKAQYAQSIVEVQNGYGDDGGLRAAALGRYLKYSKGLPTVDVGPDVAAQPTTSIVLFDNGKRDLAKDVAKWLGVPESVVTLQKKETGTEPDVLVIIGRDFKIPGS
ncbi:MAG: LCP family protein [Dehalococcoidia bacterium]|nr:LCP family protein [Dehalococcoidia bacterium]